MNVLIYMSKGTSDVIKLRILKWGDYPGSPMWPYYNHKGPYIREDDIMKKERKNFNVMLLALKMEEEAMSEGM